MVCIMSYIQIYGLKIKQHSLGLLYRGLEQLKLERKNSIYDQTCTASRNVQLVANLWNHTNSVRQCLQAHGMFLSRSTYVCLELITPTLLIIAKARDHPYQKPVLICYRKRESILDMQKTFWIHTHTKQLTYSAIRYA